MTKLLMFGKGLLINLLIAAFVFSLAAVLLLHCVTEAAGAEQLEEMLVRIHSSTLMEESPQIRDGLRELKITDKQFSDFKRSQAGRAILEAYARDLNRSFTDSGPVEWQCNQEALEAVYTANSGEMEAIAREGGQDTGAFYVGCTEAMLEALPSPEEIHEELAGTAAQSEALGGLQLGSFLASLQSGSSFENMVEQLASSAAGGRTFLETLKIKVIALGRVLLRGGFGAIGLVNMLVIAFALVLLNLKSRKFLWHIAVAAALGGVILFLLTKAFAAGPRMMPPFLHGGEALVDAFAAQLGHSVRLCYIGCFAAFAVFWLLYRRLSPEAGKRRTGKKEAEMLAEVKFYSAVKAAQQDTPADMDRNSPAYYYRDVTLNKPFPGGEEGDDGDESTYY